MPQQCNADGLLQNIEDCRESEVKSLLDRVEQLQSNNTLHNITSAREDEGYSSHTSTASRS